MALPALVLVHGGGLAADSWDLTVVEATRAKLIEESLGSAADASRKNPSD
jgi:hypothetical protein